MLTFFGLMHGESIGIGQTPTVAIAYLMVAAVLYGCYQVGHAPAPAPAHEVEPSHEISEFDEESAVPA